MLTLSVVSLADGRHFEVQIASLAMPVAALKGQLVGLTGIGYSDQRLVFAEIGRASCRERVSSPV